MSPRSASAILLNAASWTRIDSIAGDSISALNMLAAHAMAWLSDEASVTCNRSVAMTRVASELLRALLRRRSLDGQPNRNLVDELSSAVDGCLSLACFV